MNSEYKAPEPKYTTRVLPELTTPFSIYLFGLPLIPASIAPLLQGNSKAGLTGIIACILLFSAATLVKKGLRLERINTQRRWNRSTMMPWKSIGAAIAGWSVFIVSNFMLNLSLGSALLLGVLATAGTLLRYGIDTKFQQPDTVSRYGMTVDEIVELTDEARENIYRLEQATKQIRSVPLKAKLRKIIDRAKEIIDELEQDPTNLRSARKFLKVYLEGAMSVTQRYAEQGQNAQNTELDQRFSRVLDTIEDTFDEQYARLQQHDVLNLDVQIEVLEKQMKLEGLR